MSSKYFIAIVPPPPLQEEMMAMKKYFAERYKSSGAMNSPAHITLHMPFELEGEKEKRFLNTFQKFSPTISPFTISLNGYDRFAPRVIFISVKPCETLSVLQSKTVDFTKMNFNIFNQSDDLRGFHPHITIAFRDLKKPVFAEAWKEFSAKSFSATFECESISLLRRNDKKNWEVCIESPLK